MLTETVDILGQPLAQGDAFAIAYLEGKRAILRVGKVLGFSSRRDSYNSTGQVDLMEVEWYRLENTNPIWVPRGGTSKLELHQKRLIKVDLDTVLTAVVD